MTDFSPYCMESMSDCSPFQRFFMNEDEFYKRLEVIISSNPNFIKACYWRNMFLKSELQDGPKCGLVALSIASFIRDNSVNVDSIFQTALSLGYTKQGEMFSADWLAALAEKCCGFKTTVLKGGLKKHLCCIVRHLINEHPILVPYDADFNHSPCLKKGLKAHWAAISGFVLIQEAQNYNDDKDQDLQECHDCANNGASLHEPEITLYRGGITISYNREGQVRTFKGKVYLIGKQGKSKHYALWSFEDLADSNDNLVSADRSPEAYIFPEGGIIEGLKGKAVVLTHQSSENSVH